MAICKRCNKNFDTFLDILCVSPLGEENSCYCNSCLLIKHLAVYLRAQKEQPHIAKMWKSEAEKIKDNKEQITL